MEDLTELKFIYDDKLYIQRNPISKLKEYDLEGCYIKSYETIPEDIQIEIEDIKKMCKNPEDYFRYDYDDDGIIIKELKPRAKEMQNIIFPNQIDGEWVRKIAEHVLGSNLKVRNVIIPNSVRELEEGAFLSCENLINARIPDGLEEIPSMCFHNVGKLNINLKNVKRIGYMAFSVTSIEKIDLSNVEEIKSYAFHGCSSLKKVNLNNAKKLSNDIFCNCTGLEEIIFSDELTSIPMNICLKCSNLTKVKLPKKLNKIEKSAFNGCVKLSNIKFPNSLKYIEPYAFARNAFEELKLPTRLKTIGVRAFYLCKNLLEIEIPNSVIEIAPKAFENCIGLTSIKMNSKTKFAKRSFDLDKQALIQYNNKIKDDEIER